MGKFLFPTNVATGPAAGVRHATGHVVHSVQQYETARLNWSCYDAVVVGNDADQIHLTDMTQKLEAYLQGGGTIVFSGHVSRRFVPELSLFKPLPSRGRADLVVNREADHPVFSGVDGESLTYRKGVAGFYGRGCNPPPEGAVILNSISAERWPLDWTYERPAGGRLFMHAGNDICGFFAHDAGDHPGFAQRLLDWLAATSRRGSGPARAGREANKTARPIETEPAQTGGSGIAIIDAGNYYHHHSIHEAPYARFFDHIVYLRDVPITDLGRFETLIVPCRTNPLYLANLSAQLQDFMHGGGRLVVMGETFPDRWLPDIRFNAMETNFWWWLDRNADLGVRISDPAHPMASHVDARAATWHLHGTFAPLSSGQQSLIETRDGESLMFQDSQSYAPGELIATSLDPFFHHGSYFMPATTVFLQKFLTWLSEGKPAGQPARRLQTA